VSRSEELGARRSEELGARGRRLRAALAAGLVRDRAPEVRLVRAWLDSRLGFGRRPTTATDVRTERKLCRHKLGAAARPAGEVRALSSWPGARSMTALVRGPLKP
jgi:hypothetical protein